MSESTATTTYDARYEEGIARYESGEAAEALITHFQQLRKEKFDIRVSVALSWLYTLTGKKDLALHYCKEAKSVPQGKYNHALALLAFKEKGVREKIEEAYRLGGSEGLRDAMENLDEAIKRRGGVYPEAERLLKYLRELG